MASTATSGDGGVEPVSGSAGTAVGEESGSGAGESRREDGDVASRVQGHLVTKMFLNGPQGSLDAKVDSVVAEAMSSLASTSSADGATVGAQIDVRPELFTAPNCVPLVDFA